MPTGYTAKLVDEGQTFEEFAYRCVRASNAFSHMRDYDLGSKLVLPDGDFVTRGSPEKIVERKRDLAEKERELAKLLEKSNEQIEQDYERYKQEQIDYYERRLKEVTPVRDRLLAMRSQVCDWQPPTEEHKGFKDFMLQQLDETLKWDGRLPDEPDVPDTAAEWHQDEITYRKRRIERCKELLEEEKNVGDIQGSRVEFIKQLVESITPPPGTFAGGELDKIR